MPPGDEAMSDSRLPPAAPPELPARGYPYAEPSLRQWFRDRYGREASTVELGELMAAMAARDDAAGPGGSSASPGGWSVEPNRPGERAEPDDTGRK
jgi:hypothetical protein